MKRVEGVGDALIFKGNPRAAVEDIDGWLKGILSSIREPSQRAHLWGADAGLCARRNTLLRFNDSVSSEMNSATNAYMSIGVALEDMLARSLSEKGHLLGQGLWLPEVAGLKIRGRMDLVLLDGEGELTLLEVKTCGKMPVEPRPTHLTQAQTYSAISGIDKVYITYISRNVQEEWGKGLTLKSFPVDTSEEALLPRLQTAWLSALAINEEKLPPPPAHFRKHTECHYCEFRDIYCWKPRPGLLSDTDPDPWPLPELNSEELINLHSKSYDLGLTSYQERGYRFIEFLKELVAEGNVPIEYLSKLKEVMKEAKDKYISRP